MKLNCGPTPKERFKMKANWHDWFAWHPVRVGSNDCRWLETVRRKGTFRNCWMDQDWTFEYQPKEP